MSGPVARVALVKIRRYPSKAKALAGKRVRIWSGEHGAWWRINGAGYTTVREEAGIYIFEEAWSRSRHGGPEKMTAYELADPPEPCRYGLQAKAPDGHRWLRVGELIRPGDQWRNRRGEIVSFPTTEYDERHVHDARMWIRPLVVKATPMSEVEAFRAGARWGRGQDHGDVTLFANALQAEVVRRGWGDATEETT